MKFHSTELLPAEYATKTVQDIENFSENIRPSYRFTEGEEVVHRHNLKNKMIVAEIVRKGNKEKARLDGIRCHWWSD